MRLYFEEMAMIAPDEEVAVARGLVADAEGAPWFALTATYGELADVGDMQAYLLGENGDKLKFFADSAMDAFRPLRGAMTDDHGAWFSATVIVQRDGSYEFAYNYTELLEWYGGVEDESYVIDLARHPRPWGEIPDWHPVKRDFTEESWAAELAKGSK